MKYAFILSAQAFSPHGGVKVQALMWKEGLEKLGNEVELVNFWEIHDWSQFDVFIIFGFTLEINNMVTLLSQYSSNIVLAPIIDPKMSLGKFHFFCRWWGCSRLKLSSRLHNIWLAKDKVKLWLVRSEEEYRYVKKGIGVKDEDILKVPLHYRLQSIDNFPEKENFCFHASRLDEPIKNVGGLIKAAKKYGFKLKLAGNLRGEKGRDWLKSQIGDATNIEYLGLISDDELSNTLLKAKVFALPSFVEGVGMAALEAAAYGAEIVLTDIGAPKEYYQGKAILVDPYDFDEIGKGVVKALDGFSQPNLKEFVDNHYSERACMTLLHNAIMNRFN